MYSQDIVRSTVLVVGPFSAALSRVPSMFFFSVFSVKTGRFADVYLLDVRVNLQEKSFTEQKGHEEQL